MALTHPRKEKKPLEAGDRVKAKNQVSRDEIVPENQSVTFPVNIRVDNHIRNQVTALINLGVESNMKALVSHMIERQITDLDESQVPRFHKMVKILESKDYMSRTFKDSGK